MTYNSNGLSKFKRVVRQVKVIKTNVCIDFLKLNKAIEETKQKSNKHDFYTHIKCL